MILDAESMKQACLCGSFNEHLFQRTVIESPDEPTKGRSGHKDMPQNKLSDVGLLHKTIYDSSQHRISTKRSEQLARP